MSQSKVPIYFKVTLQISAVLDQVRQRLHVVVKESREPDFERYSRATAIESYQHSELPQQMLN